MKSRHSPATNPRANSPSRGAAALRRWYAGKAPILGFGTKFAGLTVLFYLILLLPVCTRMVSSATVADARLCSLVLNLVGIHNHVEGATMFSGTRSVITVASNCSGFDFLCFFTAAVLVFPVPFSKKLPGVLIGIPLLLALNLVRIMSLFVLGVHFPGIFDMAHEQIWAIILIAASIILFITWMRWAGPVTLRQPDATA